MENKNLILAIALSVAILFGWQFFWEKPKREAELAKQQATQQQAAEVGTNQSASSGSSSAGGSAPSIGAQAPSTGTAASASGGYMTREEALAAVPRVKIATPRLTGSINLKGARIDDLTLTDYHETIDKSSPNIVLLEPVGTEKPYYAEFGWVAGDAASKGLTLPGPDTVWTADGDTLSPDSPVTLSWTSPQGIVFDKTFAIDKNYMVTVTEKIMNASADSVTLLPYSLVSRTGTPKTLGYYLLHEGLLGVFDGTLKEVKYKDLKKDGDIKMPSEGGWLGITDKYWLAAVIPDPKAKVQTAFSYGQRGNEDLYQADFLGDAQTVAPGASAEVTTRLFAGAKETLLLDKYQKDLGIVNFDLAVDFGWFYFLTKPIFYAIHWLHRFLDNFGLAIIALTFCIKAAFFPLANKSYRSMSKMKLLQPKMKELKERFGDDRQKLNTAMMELYKKEKVNPLSGCLPIVIQIPVFFSLYKVLFVTIEMRHAPFFGWIHDLSSPDPLGLLTGFGLVHWSVPASLAVVNIGIWPILMGLTMFLQQRLNPAPADPVQQKVFMFMPLIFTFMLAHFPAGLVIYWTFNNLLSITQQWIIMKRMGVAVGGGKAKA